MKLTLNKNKAIIAYLMGVAITFSSILIAIFGGVFAALSSDVLSDGVRSLLVASWFWYCLTAMGTTLAIWGNFSYIKSQEQEILD